MRSSVLLALLWVTVVSLSLLVVSSGTPLRLLRTSNSALQPEHSEHTWVETQGQVNEGEGLHAPPVVDLNAPYDYDPYLAVASAFGVNVANGQRPDLEIVRQLHKATFQGSENPALYAKARKREAELNAKIGAELKQKLGRDPLLKEIKQEKGQLKWRPAIEATKLTNGEVRFFVVTNQRRLVTDAQNINLADWAMMGQPRTRTVVHPTTGVGSITYKLDKFGRVIEVSGPTRIFNKGLGTKASSAAVAWSNAVYRFHFDAVRKATHLEKEKNLEKFTPISVPGTAEVGHIFGASPGGSNDDTINFFPQDITSNKNKAGVDSAWSVGEHLAQALQQDVQTVDGQVRIRITLEYKKASDLIPYGGEYQVLWANALDQLLYKGVTVNAYVANLHAGWEYALTGAPAVVEKAQPGYHSRTWKWTNPIAGL